MRPTLFLLHALGASGRSFDPVVARLGERFDCVAPDLPGFGDRVDAVHTGISDTLDWLSHHIAAQAPERYLLVGHSMGGKFATLLSARAEAGAGGLEGLRGTVLLAASPPAPEPMEEDRRAKMIGWFDDGGPDEAEARRFVEANIAGPLGAEAMARAIADVRRTAPAAWTGWLERGAREDRREEAGRLKTPALIVAGAADGDLGEANQRRLNLPHYPHGRIAVVPGAAHLLPLERPDAVADLIADFAGTLD